jgi:hypothetical protein
MAHFGLGRQRTPLDSSARLDKSLIAGFRENEIDETVLPCLTRDSEGLHQKLVNRRAATRAQLSHRDIQNVPCCDARASLRLKDFSRLTSLRHHRAFTAWLVGRAGAGTARPAARA